MLTASVRARWTQGAVTVAAITALALALVPRIAHGQEDTGGDLRACPVDAPPAAFDDRHKIPEAHLDSVDCAAFFDILRGFVDDTTRPTDRVRRDQMASFIARTLEAADVALPAPEDGKDFVDVDEDSPHRDNIRKLAAADVVLGGPLGRPDDSYGVELPTRRDQMTSLIVRAAEFAYDETFDSQDQQFDDVSDANVHFANVNFAAESGLVLGFDEDTFGPRQRTRRDQMTSFVVRLLNFLTVPVDVAITEQSAEQAEPGETITVTATVFNQFRDVAQDEDEARFPDGEDVTFQTDGAVPEQGQTVETDQDGDAAFTFTSGEPGTVTVTASIGGPGGNFLAAGGDSDSVEKEFTLDPAFDPAEVPEGADPAVAASAERTTAEPGAAKKVTVTWEQPVVPGARNPWGYKLYRDEECTVAVNTGVGREPAEAADDEVVVQFVIPVGGADLWLGVATDTERIAENGIPNAEQCLALGD